MSKMSNDPSGTLDLFSSFGEDSARSEEAEVRKAPEAEPVVTIEPEMPEQPGPEESEDGADEREAGQESRELTVEETLPAVLSDGLPPESNGELTLARYAAQAYLEYALSVVKSRALPDVFDGMKPVQRRILFAMDRMRLLPTAKAVKCARVVGDVLGKYHPHGDQAAYDAMVRMAQSFSLRYPLVDGQGNFGSRDGDGPAAMRYTEARLTAVSQLLLEELDSEDVDFIPNYDGAFKEPVQLPARMPFVLLNGASGIAVGMATEIPPHNMNEVGEAILKMLDNPACSLDEIMQVMPAPDFPGGSQIISSPSDIRAIYESGRGSLRMRARYHFEDLQRGQWQLVVDELPPAANTEMVLAQIEDLTNPKPKTGKKALSAEQQNTKAQVLALLDGVRNECDKDTPVRIVFEPKTSRIDRNLFVNTLLSLTSLECNAPVNLVMLGIDGRPRQKGLLEILSEWVSARTSTVRRRSQARLNKVNARLHILDGRLIAIDNIDRVIEIVRFDPDPKGQLMREFSLSEAQAEDILELRLRQLANLEIEKLRQEMAKLNAEKHQLERILANDRVLAGVIAKETREAMRDFGDARRTLVREEEKASVEPVVASEPVTIVISEKGYVRCRTGHGHDVSLMNFKMGDALLYSAECMSEDTLICVGSDGRTYSIAVSALPSARGDGLPVRSLIDLEHGTEIIGYLAGPAKTRVMLATDEGFGLACEIGNMVARVRSGKAFLTLTPGASILPPQIIRQSARRIACLSAEGRQAAERA
jgi:topoisomerase-4 subunit A